MDEITALKTRIAQLEAENASLLINLEQGDALLGDANRHTDRLEAEVARLRGQPMKIRTRMSETVAMMLAALKYAGPKGAEVKDFADMTTMGKSRAYYLVNRMAEDGVIRRVGHVEPVRYALVENPGPEVSDYYRKAGEVIG